MSVAAYIKQIQSFEEYSIFWGALMSNCNAQESTLRNELTPLVERKEIVNLRFPFSVESEWFSGATKIKTYSLNELLGTKLRALYQRKKRRDLFDLDYARIHGNINLDEIIKSFNKYMEFSTAHIPTRRQFELNIEEKKTILYSLAIWKHF